MPIKYNTLSVPFFALVLFHFNNRNITNAAKFMRRNSKKTVEINLKIRAAQQKQNKTSISLQCGFEEKYDFFNLVSLKKKSSCNPYMIQILHRYKKNIGVEIINNKKQLLLIILLNYDYYFRI